MYYKKMYNKINAGQSEQCVIYVNFKSLIKLTQYITHFRLPVRKILYITSDETMHEGIGPLGLC